MNKKNRVNYPKLLLLALLIAMPVLLILPRDSQNPKSYAQQTIPQGIFPVYGIYANVLDNFANAWTAKISYGGASSRYEIYNKAPTYSGANSIAWTLTSSSYEQLEMTAPQNFDITPYTYLTLYMRAGVAGQRFGAVIIEADGTSSPYVPMEPSGGLPNTSYWTIYNIPIASFNIPSKTIKGIAIKDLNGGPLDPLNPAPVYIDEINFSAQQGQNIAPPSNGIQISAPTSIPTPAMPYYPDISPWVYIIPGIIVGLAIIFQ